MKICTKCSQSKDESEFYLKRGKPRALCKSCHKVYYINEYKTKNKEYRERNKKWRDNNPHIKKNLGLKSLYNITLQEWNNLLQSQNNKCAICNNDNPSKLKSFDTDHCHKTGKVRGLLCHSCNVGLGNFKDNIDYLKSAISYLDRHNK